MHDQNHRAAELNHRSTEPHHRSTTSVSPEGTDMAVSAGGVQAHPASRRALLLGGVLAATGLATATMNLVSASPASAAPPATRRTLRSGAKGADVLAMQRELSRLHYWLGTADGKFGPLTLQAVYALQKAAGLKADGVVGPKTYAALDRGAQPSRRITSGTAFELDKGRQLLLCISKGKLAYILNTSTGNGARYYSGGRWKRATTPSGDFRMYRLYSKGWQSGPLGSMYRPGYYSGGWAIHGSSSIPPYPASHGCARISTGAADMLWSRSWFVTGRRVLVR